MNPPSYKGVASVEIQATQWSPVGSSIAFIYQNNIYYKQNPSSDAVQITRSGSEKIFNGIADWVYEGKMTIQPPGAPASLHLFKSLYH